MLPYEINPIGIVGTGVLDRPFFSRFRGWSGRPIPTHTELDCAKSNTPTNPNLSGSSAHNLSLCSQGNILCSRQNRVISRDVRGPSVKYIKIRGRLIGAPTIPIEIGRLKFSAADPFLLSITYYLSSDLSLSRNVFSTFLRDIELC